MYIVILLSLFCHISLAFDPLVLTSPAGALANAFFGADVSFTPTNVTNLVIGSGGVENMIYVYNLREEWNGLKATLIQNISMPIMPEGDGMCTNFGMMIHTAHNYLIAPFLCNSSRIGAVQIFWRQSSSSEYVAVGQPLKAPLMFPYNPPPPVNGFGTSIAIWSSGGSVTYMLVGDQRCNNELDGCVFSYGLNGATTPVYMGVIRGDSVGGGMLNARFGNHISVLGNELIAILAPSEEYCNEQRIASCPGAGAIFLFNQSLPLNQLLDKYLKSANPSEGYDVLHEALIWLHHGVDFCTGMPTYGTDLSGAVVCFIGTDNERIYFFPPPNNNGNANAEFGESMAAFGDYVVVGAPGHGTGFVYRRNLEQSPTKFELVHQFSTALNLNYHGISASNFPLQVDINEYFIVGAAPYDELRCGSHGSCALAGSVSVFARSQLYDGYGMSINATNTSSSTLAITITNRHGESELSSSSSSSLSSLVTFIGIIIGVLLFIALFLLTIYCFLFRRKKKRADAATSNASHRRSRQASVGGATRAVSASSESTEFKGVVKTRSRNHSFYSKNKEERRSRVGTSSMTQARSQYDRVVVDSTHQRTAYDLPSQSLSTPTSPSNYIKTSSPFV